MGIATLSDLLRFVPRGHHVRPRTTRIADVLATNALAADGSVAANTRDRRVVVRGRVSSYRSGRRRGTPSRLVVADGTGQIEVLLYQLRRIPNSSRHGSEVVIDGRVDDSTSPIRLIATAWAAGEDALDDGAPRPLYDLPDSIPPRVFARWIKSSLPLVDQIDDPVAASTTTRFGLPSLPDALRCAHAPASAEEVERARRRFAADELATCVAPLVARRRALETFDKGRSIDVSRRLRDELMALLPFPPTNDQRLAFDAIADDLASRRPMHRLLQGEVGSGKTAVAMLALLAVARAGKRCALLAPTALLASQHAAFARTLFEPIGIPVLEFTNATPIAERRAMDDRLRGDSPCLAIGTLRLLSALPRIALAVIDEQQRFGVSQRARSRADPTTDLLVMTATPIPRSLALVLYGDLDLSVLRELPAGRSPITTEVVDLDDGSRWREEVRREVESGGRVFVVCPRIEGFERASATAVVRTLRDVIGREVVAIAHGALEPRAIAKALQRFRAGDATVLVSTVLVEVGIDVPEATLIVVLGAERFGLAQLHQLRGRVGRGRLPGRCLLVIDTPTESARARAAALVASNSGFEIAEADLRLRGAGTIAGERQHGDFEFRHATLPRDLDLLPYALAAGSSDPATSTGEGRSAAWDAVGPG